MPSRARAQRRIPALHGDRVPAGATAEDMDTQMAHPREVVLSCGPSREHLVAVLAPCQSPRAGQHGVDSEEEAFGTLPLRHSLRLSPHHTPGSKNLGYFMWIPEPLHPFSPSAHSILSDSLLFT